MNLRTIAALCFLGAAISGCASMGVHSVSNKEKATAVINNFGTVDRSSLSYISDANYIEHNLSTLPGKAGLLAFLDQFPSVPKDPEGNVVRSLQDGEYVVLHSNVKSYNAAVFDVFRFDDGLIVEHWDNIQPTADKPNASGHTQTDGTTQITDLDKTQQNKKLVKNLVQNVLVDGKFNTITQYISQESYTQHSPWFGDGLQALTEGFAAMAAQGQIVKYEKIHAILGEGNFVLAISSGDANGSPTSFYDLFRVENDKIVEHWDAVETILSEDEQMNNHGKFNFPSSAMNLSK